MSGEVLLPETRCELRDATRGMFADPLQDIDQVGVRIDAWKDVGPMRGHFKQAKHR